MGTIWWRTGRTCPSTFSYGGHVICHVPQLFLCRLCIWRDFKESDVCHVLCEELFMLDDRPRIAKLMLKQSLVWHHWILLVYKF